MHDCEEFLGDWSSPVKMMLGRGYVKERIGPVKDALRRWFGFDDEHPAIKHADLVSMATELRDLLPPAWIEWGHLPQPHPAKINPVGPDRLTNCSWNASKSSSTRRGRKNIQTTT